ncbi:MAG TPA: cell envelope integrity protein TolA, partial [Aquirhabdus sp.]
AKKLAAKEAADTAKTVKERAIKDAKLALEKDAKFTQEKANKEAKAKAVKEQAIKDAKAAKANQEDIDKLLRKANADALRRFSQSMGNDDAEIGHLKSQVAANSKANSIGKYKSQIESRIKNSWRVPSGSSGSKATARITLSADGSIASVVIISPSDSDDFNASIKALNGHSGLPVPDDSDTFRQVNPLIITFKAP